MAQLTFDLYAINKATFTAKHEHIRSENLKHTQNNTQLKPFVYPGIVFIDLYLLTTSPTTGTLTRPRFCAYYLLKFLSGKSWEMN